MSELSKNSWSQGMDKDTSKSKYFPERYLDATNFRILTDKGLSSYSLENIKGTLALSGGTLLDLPIVQKITLDGTATGGNVVIQISDGVFTDGGSVYDTTSKTTKDFYDFLTPANGYSNINIEYTVYYNNLYLLVVPITANPLTITDTLALGNSVIDPAFIPAQTDLQVIGGAFINDDIYLLTTNNTQTTPTTGYGQIWKLVINDTTNIATLTNVYNNQVNFSTYNAVAPTAILGRYENALTQRIYWTDFYNKLRSLNVADPQAFATDLSLLDVVPAVDFDIPIMQQCTNVPGSSVKMGAYQVAYRLKNTGGAVTNFSELSNIVYVVLGNESNNTMGNSFAGYTGAPASISVDKQITWKIDNIDTDFDRIEIVVVYRKNTSDVGTFNLIYDEPLDTDSFEFTYNGTQKETPITIDEFLTLSSVFTHCKTITTKDNRLIVGNIRNDQQELDFDCRAFRAFTSTLNSTDILLTNNNVQSSNTLAQAIATNQESDAINDYSDPLRACYWKPDVPVAGVLGGKGANVSYEFYTVAISADKTATGQILFNVADTVGAPWRSTNPRFFGSPDLDLNVTSPTNTPGVDSIQTYPPAVPDINDGFKYPHINSLFKGYNRNEIYRIGIQFYDKAKNPYFVKWVGDIKFPDFEDPNTNAFYEDGSVAPHADFRLSFISNKPGYTECYVQALGLQITIENLEDISDQISGYSIVRVKREPEDKSIVAQGYITPVDEQGGEFYTTSPRGSSDGNSMVNPIYPTRGFFVTPEIINPTVKIDADLTLKIKTLLATANSDVSILNTGGGQPYYMYKMYTWGGPTGQADKGIDQITPLDYGGSTVETSSGTPVFNYDFGLGGDPVTTSQSIGNQAYFISLDGAVIYPVTGAGKLFCTLERVLTNQYGGNTYTARANNEYIPCNHFRPIRTTGLPITDTFQLFGGDIYVNMYDSCRWAKNFNTHTSRGMASELYSTTFYFPVESTINTDLRHGIYMNKDFTGGVNFEMEMKEFYNYNSVYSQENDIKKYFPKPDPYLPITEFNNRFYISQIKINGEQQDAWGVFKALDYWDVEGSYGPINACDVLQDQVYFAQDKAFGKLLVNPRTAITSQDGDTIQIGRGNVIDSHDYISTEIGSKHQWSFLKSAYQIFFWDARHNKIYTFNPSAPLNPISDIKGMHSWLQLNAKSNLLNTDKPVYEAPLLGINGIHGVYDYVNNELIYTFAHRENLEVPQEVYTLVYSEKLNAFTAFYSHTPKIYITNHKKIVSPEPGGANRGKNLFLHNYGNYGEFYGIFYPSTIEILANKYPEITKTFDNLIMQTEVQTFDAATNTFIDTSYNTPFTQETFNTVECKNDYQTSGIINLNAANLVRRFRTWRTQIPRSNQQAANMSTGFFSRLKDKYLRIKLSFLNNGNKRFIVHDIVNSFRINRPT